LNALYNKHQFWDGRVTTLEQQAALPIATPFEMGSTSVGEAISRIASDRDYQTRFTQAFDRNVNEQDLLSAIAAYEQTLTSFRFPLRPFHRRRGNRHQRDELRRRVGHDFDNPASRRAHRLHLSYWACAQLEANRERNLGK
jgi:cytochrome c peroxidase